MCNHKFQMNKKSVVIIKGKCIPIEIFKCVHCQELQIIDKEKCRIISCGGKFGKEAKL